MKKKRKSARLRKRNKKQYIIYLKPTEEMKSGILPAIINENR